ncbi:leucyl aminopeptidase family protein [Spongisporangium articulatum]|uniref:Probable cytosol aminopeptidase n=1 Tax=Spongisporangium articulatum TaxID=3362603 RepID=A0ABW8AQ93_9ACTN
MSGPTTLVAAARTRVRAHPSSLPDALGDSALTRPAAAVAVPVAPAVARAEASVPREVAAVARAYGVDLGRVFEAERFRGGAGEVLRVPVQAPDGLPNRLLLVGVGGAAPADLRRSGAALARAVRGSSSVLTSLGAGAGRDGVAAAVEGLVLGGYEPPSAGQRNRKDAAAVGEVVLASGRATGYPAAAVEAGLTAAQAAVTARDLAQTPSSVKSPQWLATQARRLAEKAGLDVEVWDEKRLAAEGFGGVLAVGAGSATPPRFVRIDYRPRGTARQQPVVLVGKGITYDTGGLSIKPRESMVPMKTDMSGAAAVLAAVVGAPAAGVTRPVTALLPMAENAFGGSSYRPADVVTVRGGTTVEILNTDAEGRMVLADALAYADDSLDPDTVLDLATLTGAASLGLGKRHAALYATDARLAASLVAAGTAAGEGVWELPLAEDYRSALDSPIADLRHVPGPGQSVGGGSITAALFLREFTGGRRWAHLDIAGPARSDRDEYEICRGGTGFGARLVLRWLQR